MPMRKDSTKTVSNPLLHNSKAKIEGRRMLAMAVSTLFPLDLSVWMSRLWTHETRVLNVSQDHWEKQGLCCYLE